MAKDYSVFGQYTFNSTCSCWFNPNRTDCGCCQDGAVQCGDPMGMYCYKVRGRERRREKERGWRDKEEGKGTVGENRLGRIGIGREEKVGWLEKKGSRKV